MSTNLFRALRELLPEAPLQVATVVTVHTATGESTVAWPGASQQRVRGTGVAAPGRAYVRNGVIEGPAPNLTLVDIDV
jgi:hypothetical protein